MTVDPVTSKRVLVVGSSPRATALGRVLHLFEPVVEIDFIHLPIRQAIEDGLPLRQSLQSSGDSRNQHDPAVIVEVTCDHLQWVAKKCEQLVIKLRSTDHWRGAFYPFVAPHVESSLQSSRLFRDHSKSHWPIQWYTPIYEILRVLLRQDDQIRSDKWRTVCVETTAWDALTIAEQYIGRGSDDAVVSALVSDAIAAVRKCSEFVPHGDLRRSFTATCERLRFGLKTRTASPTAVLKELRDLLHHYKIRGEVSRTTE